MSSNGKQDEPDYEALNNTFYSIVDSWLPKDFGKKGVQQKDADVLVKIRKAKEKERHRAANAENGDASTSSIPHASLLKRKLQAGSANKSKDSVTLEAGKSDDDDESGDESRTRSIAKKAKTGFDAFSKPSKAKSKGKQKDDGSGLTTKAGPVDDVQETSGSTNGTGSAPKPYANPFAMPSITNPTASAPVDTPPTSPPRAPIPHDNSTSDSPDAVKTDTDGLTKSQRKKQRKKEKKALAREESVKQQQLLLGKLAVAQ